MAFSSLVLLLACSACSTFSYVSAETHLRYDEPSDVLTVLEIEHGLYSPGKATLNGAVSAVESVAAGRRVYPPDEGLFVIDFDRMAQDPDAENLENESARDRDVREFAKGVSITKCGLFLDAAGQLSLYRLWSVPHVRAGLKLANDGINEGVLDDKNAFDEFSTFDRETQALFRERASAHGTWLLVQDGALVFDAPMTASSAARCVEYLRAESDKAKDADMAALWRRLSRLEIVDGHARLRFEPDKDGWFHVESKSDPRHYSSNVLDAIDKEDRSLVQSVTLEEVRALMNTR